MALAYYWALPEPMSALARVITPAVRAMPGKK
jgi:hypothetical protein